MDLESHQKASCAVSLRNAFSPTMLYFNLASCNHVINEISAFSNRDLNPLHSISLRSVYSFRSISKIEEDSAQIFLETPYNEKII